jgi:hypothetical protein
MPTVDASPEEMTALLAYLKTLGGAPAISPASLSSVPPKNTPPDLLGLQLNRDTASAGNSGGSQR